MKMFSEDELISYIKMLAGHLSVPRRRGLASKTSITVYNITQILLRGDFTKALNNQQVSTLKMKKYKIRRIADNVLRQREQYVSAERSAILSLKKVKNQRRRGIG